MSKLLKIMIKTILTIAVGVLTVFTAINFGDGDLYLIISICFLGSFLVGAIIFE